VSSMPRIPRKSEECCTFGDQSNLPLEVEKGLCRAGGLEKLIAKLPEQKGVTEEAKLHRALADPTRIRILHSLSQCNLCPCILKEITGLSDSKLSYHLRIMEETELVISIPKQKWRIYELTDLGRSWMRFDKKGD